MILKEQIDNIEYQNLFDEIKYSNDNKENTNFNLRLITSFPSFQLKNLIEYFLKKNNINSEIISNNGIDYFNQNLINFENNDIYLIFLDIHTFENNLVDKLHKINSDEEYKSIENYISEKLKLFLKYFLKKKVIIMEFIYLNDNKNKYISKILKKLNNILYEFSENFIKIINTNNFLTNKNFDKFIDSKNFERFLSPYNFNFYKKILVEIRFDILKLYGKEKKVLVIDLDNTLWPGIISEDNAQEIIEKYNNSKYLHHKNLVSTLDYLYDMGIILCISSKNYHDDAIDFFNTYFKFFDHKKFVIKKINWQEKSKNILKISNELNIKTDSIVFLDDSDFEIEEVNSTIHDIISIKFDLKLLKSLETLKEIKKIFHKNIVTLEDSDKQKLIKQKIKSDRFRENFSDINSFIKNLNINIKVSVNKNDNIERISQISFKTNQFNLYPERYGLEEIKNFVDDDSYDLIQYEIHDKFGNNGICGFNILKKNNDSSIKILYFALSCRILGRGIENAIIGYIFNKYYQEGYNIFQAKYFFTNKNSIYKNFYKSFFDNETYFKEEKYYFYEKKFDKTKLKLFLNELNINYYNIDEIA